MAGEHLSTHMAYSQMIIPFIMAGAGMALVFAPSAKAILALGAPRAGRPGVRREQRDPRGRRRARRGGARKVFTARAATARRRHSSTGPQPALWVGVAVLGAGALTVLALPFGGRAREAQTASRFRR